MSKGPGSFYLIPPQRPQVGAPRRFDIGTIVILAIVFAVFFGIATLLNFPSSSYGYITIFIGGVAACQLLLFKGKYPRETSIISGSVIFYLLMVFVSLTNDFGPRDFTRQITFSIQGFFVNLGIGGLLGYLVGGLISCGFWIRDKIGKSTVKTLPSDNGNPP